MTQENVLDVRRVIEENTRIKTLKELELEGKRAVKVVRASQMYDLITEAVEKTMRSKSLDLADQQKLDVIKQSNEEFRRLVHEREEERRHNEGREAMLAQYEGEIRKLRSEIDRVTQEHTDDRRKQIGQKQIFDEATSAADRMKLELRSAVEERDRAVRAHEEDRKKIDELQAEVRRLLERRDQDQSRAEQASQMTAQSAEELRALREDLKKVLHDQENSEANRRAQAQMIADYERRIVTLTDDVRTARERAMPPEMITALMGDVQAIRSSFEQIGQHGHVHPAEQARRDEMLQREATAISMMEKLFAEKMEKMSKQISNKIEDLSFKPKEKPVEAAQIVLDNLFRDDSPMETNLGNVGVREQAGAGILGALKRLRSLQGGAEPTEEAVGTGSDQE